jgi:hypothetical protein
MVHNSSVFPLIVIEMPGSSSIGQRFGCDVNTVNNGAIHAGRGFGRVCRRLRTDEGRKMWRAPRRGGIDHVLTYGVLARASWERSARKAEGGTGRRSLVVGSG